MSAVAARLVAFFRKNFPERQIYIRSAGEVQFFTFGTTLQASLAALAMIFLGWAAFATVFVVFKDRSIAAMDYRYDETRLAYDARLSAMQHAYGGLGAALAGSERDYQQAVGALTKKQRLIVELLARESKSYEIIRTSAKTAGNFETETSDDGFTPDFIVNPAASSGLAKQGQTRARSPNSSRASEVLAGIHGLFGTLVLAARSAALPFFSRNAQSDNTVQNPALRALIRQENRVRTLDKMEGAVLTRVEGTFNQHIINLRDTIRRTGIDPGRFLEKFASVDAVGGPEVPLDQVRISGIDDSGFTSAYLRAGAMLERLATLSSAMSHIPLDMPVSAARFDRTSGFGPRLDPFTGHYAFHPGLDFGGPWGAAVVATAPGTVAFAGDGGSYGLTVEIDHGMGFHTRYAHLSALAVHKGMRVAKNTVIGRVGSTGRSTGPHVHYEIWYDNVVRNPGLFIAAGGHAYTNPLGSTDASSSAIGNDQD
jgi:murein DD-endopeptidase MepM/ murein hydrolase activator NlpD